ncbi:hypothetical protein [Actibacterium sp. XHP0104]|uniref:hypothetical protein n=1 Tax=Actibacterium sp. XHP0104 TaxID=2984335 RepID=UPI0021E80D6E|nr:hypothetical protein [Actibacterium sp. XHP0104]MCV2881408.1 hypothetical protein [Actibacterium sp. XHP0104]
MSDTPIATLSVSPMRRWFGVGCLMLLGGLLLAVGLGRGHAAPGWQMFLIVFGLVCVMMGEFMRRATAGRIELTEDGLRDGDGNVIAALNQIDKVSRGTFAAKPSNGFVLVLKQPMPRRWAPGMWWRLGNRVGVGGVTAPAQTRALAETIEAMLRAGG